MDEQLILMLKNIYVCVYICVYIYVYLSNKCGTGLLASQMVLVVKNLPANAGDTNFIPGSGIPWRRAWQVIPVFLPGEPHGQRSLAGYSP